MEILSECERVWACVSECERMWVSACVSQCVYECEKMWESVCVCVEMEGKHWNVERIKAGKWKLQIFCLSKQVILDLILKQFKRILSYHMFLSKLIIWQLWPMDYAGCSFSGYM